jgi:hypothetical protein
MNNRHIQTFLTVSAAFFALSAPLHSKASVRVPANAAIGTAQHVSPKQAGACSQSATQADKDA